MWAATGDRRVQNTYTREHVGGHIAPIRRPLLVVTTRAALSAPTQPKIIKIKRKKYPPIRIKPHAFALQPFALDVSAAESESGRGAAVGEHHAVAGYDDGRVVGVEQAADGAGGAGIALSLIHI